MEYWITAEGSGHFFFWAFPMCLLGLFIFLKNRRIMFVIPSCIISLMIVNPWFYKKWIDLGLYAYWRILWIIPVVPVVAAVIPVLVEKLKKKSVKSFVCCMGIASVTLMGTFVYSTNSGQFTISTNNSKLPKEVVQVADRLLEMEEQPRVILQNPLGVYIRQYTGKIDSLYGRDISGGYILRASNIAQKVYEEVNNPASELGTVKQFMLDEGYDYLVLNGTRDLKNEFELVDTVADYGIYRPLGTPRVIKERNVIGQVVSESTVDIYGDIINNAYGYSTIHYTYDSDGNIAQKWYTKANNDVFICPGDYILIEQDWDSNGVLLKRVYKDLDGQPKTRTDGYAYVEWKIDDRGVKHVSLYDLDGREIDVTGLNFAKDVQDNPDGWSEWMTPAPNTENCCFSIGEAYLDAKEEGDYYTCQIEIEFSDVTRIDGVPFRFYAQGAADGRWDINNVWDATLVWFTEPPKNGEYKFTATKQIDLHMAEASKFDLGFRCDNWASGSFRIRKVMIEKGTIAGEWKPGI